MISSHAVSKSTFRISIVGAVVAAAYTAYEGWQSNVQAYNGTLQMVLTYECGGAQSDDNLRAALNGARIDLSKVGCSNRPFFWASYHEIIQAREGKLRREKLSDYSDVQSEPRRRGSNRQRSNLVCAGQCVGCSFSMRADSRPLDPPRLQEYLT